MKQKIAGLLTIFLLSLLGLGLSGTLTIFWDFVSLLFVPGLVIGGLYAKFGNDISRLQDIKIRNKILSASIPMTATAGFFGVVSSLIITFANLDDWSKIGSSLSICLVPAVYSTLLILTCQALKAEEDVNRAATADRGDLPEI